MRASHASVSPAGWGCACVERRVARKQRKRQANTASLGAGPSRAPTRPDALCRFKVGKESWDDGRGDTSGTAARQSPAPGSPKLTVPQR
jgi:hypothetical protein